MMQSDAERLKVLEQLEAGEVDFDQALSELSGVSKEAPSDSSTAAAPTKRRWHLWWLIPFYFGVVTTGAGVVLAI